MNWILPFVILNLLTTLAATNQLDNLGVIRATNSITWSDPNAYSDRVIFRGYKLYVGSTNEVALSLTNLHPVGIVTTNLWPGTNIGLNGRFALAATIMAGLVSTNPSNPSLMVTNDIESDFSPVASLELKNGLPVPPNNFQLFAVLQSMATNALPSLGPPVPTAPLPGIMDLSGR